MASSLQPSAGEIKAAFLVTALGGLLFTLDLPLLRLSMADQWTMVFTRGPVPVRRHRGCLGGAALARGERRPSSRAARASPWRCASTAGQHVLHRRGGSYRRRQCGVHHRPDAGHRRRHVACGAAAKGCTPSPGRQRRRPFSGPRSSPPRGCRRATGRATCWRWPPPSVRPPSSPSSAPRARRWRRAWPSGASPRAHGRRTAFTIVRLRPCWRIGAFGVPAWAVAGPQRAHGHSARHRAAGAGPARAALGGCQHVLHAGDGADAGLDLAAVRRGSATTGCCSAGGIVVVTLTGPQLVAARGFAAAAEAAPALNLRN